MVSQLAERQNNEHEEERGGGFSEMARQYARIFSQRAIIEAAHRAHRGSYLRLSTQIRGFRAVHARARMRMNMRMISGVRGNRPATR